MTLAQAAPAVPSAPASRLVPARVDGNEIHVSCPSWCSLDHVAENPRNIVDLYHFSDYADLEMPRAGQSPALLGFARLGVDPFSPSPEQRTPYLYVEDGGCATDGYQHRAEAQQFARNLIAFAEKVLALSEHLPE